MRAIARDAGVNQAMIHYYFQSKEGLFSEVIGRCAGDINAKRAEALETLFANGIPTLEALMEGLMRPTLEHGEDSGASNYSYARLIVELGNASDQRSRQLVAQHYDPVGLCYIEALKKVLPGLDDAAAVEGYLYSVSVMLSVMARTGRAQKLAEQTGAKCDDLCSTESIVRFVCAGLRALESQVKTTSKI